MAFFFGKTEKFLKPGPVSAPNFGGFTTRNTKSLIKEYNFTFTAGSTFAFIVKVNYRLCLLKGCIKHKEKTRQAKFESPDNAKY